MDKLLLKLLLRVLQTKYSGLYNKMIGEDSSPVNKLFPEESDTEICPAGTVPIQRISKADLIRERHAFEGRRMERTNRPRTYVSINNYN